MLQLVYNRLFNLQQELVVSLNSVRRVDHQRAHHVGAVGLVARAQHAHDHAKVKVVLVTATRSHQNEGNSCH